MSHTNPKSQDLLQAELQAAKNTEIIDAITWRITDIINSASTIQQVSSTSRPTYSNKVKLQRAAADLRDVSSKLQEIEQYLSS